MAEKSGFTAVEGNSLRSFAEFVERVDKLVADGWLLHGPMIITPAVVVATVPIGRNELAPARYYQALFRRTGKR